MRRPLLLALVLVVLVVAYGAADVYDLVPGFLTRAGTTRAQGATPAPTVSVVRPSPSPSVSVAGPLAPLDPAAARPTRAGVRAALASLLSSPALGHSVGLSVRDGETGAELFAQGADTLRTPASSLKLLTTAAVWTALKPGDTMTTRVVQGSAANRVVLVAGGDTLLARGRGSTGATAGRAGLRDLAAQVAGRLREAGTTSVRVSLDLTYDAGPRYPASWQMADVRAGYTQGVAMTGLAGQRPSPGKPSPTRPETQVAAAFVTALRGEGVSARLATSGTYTAHAAAGAAELGAVESASYGDVLAVALADSDDALMENLARQAAVRAGHPATFAGSVDFVLQALALLGVDTDGLVLHDTCGLGAGTLIRVSTLSDVLALAASGTEPALQASVASLPVAGLSGTLATRFEAPGTATVAGIPRAKTGTLTGTSALAGTTVDRDGRLLLFAVVADAVPPRGTVAARTALERLVAALTGCGCR